MVIIIWEPWLLHSLGANGHKCTLCHFERTTKLLWNRLILNNIMFKAPHELQQSIFCCFQLRSKFVSNLSFTGFEVPMVPTASLYYDIKTYLIL
jgi:hypothetical protein